MNVYGTRGNGREKKWKRGRWKEGEKVYWLREMGGMSGMGKMSGIGHECS